MLPDEPNDEERLQELPEDNGTPFRPADPSEGTVAADDTHPDTDTDADNTELYNEGIPGEEPNAGNAVVGYDEPDKTGSLS